jgi:hypothetical protein
MESCRGERGVERGRAHLFVGCVCSVVFAFVGCGGATPPPDSAASESSGSSSHAASPPKSDDDGPTPAPAATTDSTPAPSGGGTPYDAPSVEIELNRALVQVKKNCGSATDENGAATGPWGKTSIGVTLGRNGHVKQVSLAPEFDGKPTGVCTQNAFMKIQFPPYAGSTDAVVTRDVEIPKPKH